LEIRQQTEVGVSRCRRGRPIFPQRQLQQADRPAARLCMETFCLATSSAREESDIAAGFDREGSIAIKLDFFCGLPRYVALAIRLAKQTNVALCPTPHNSLSKALQELQAQRSTASARVYCCEFGVYRHVRFGGCNVSLGVRVPLAP
jgi:hypothetical protein